MVEITNGVYAKLKQENPSLILMRCVCRSIQLVMSSAYECVSRNFEYVIAKSHKLAAKSSVAQCQYNELNKTINDGSQPFQIPFDCKTR